MDIAPIIETLLTPYRLIELHDSFAWCIIPAMYFIHMFRGGHFGAASVREATNIHPRAWASLALTLLFLLFFTVQAAVIIGLGWWCAMAPAWDRWFTFNRHTREVAESGKKFERFIETISDIGSERRDWLAFILRIGIFSIPGSTAFAWFHDIPMFLTVGIVSAFIFGAGYVTMYHAGQRYLWICNPSWDWNQWRSSYITAGEWWSGPYMGVVFLALAYLT